MNDAESVQSTMMYYVLFMEVDLFVQIEMRSLGGVFLVWKEEFGFNTRKQ